MTTTAPMTQPVGAGGRFITCLGEGLMDFLPIRQGGETVGFRLAPGGSILNVAVGLARLGAPAAFAGRLADDFFGRRLRGYLRTEGVNLDYLTIAPGRTTLAFVTPPQGMQGAAGAEPGFSFYGEGAADTLLTLADLPRALDTVTAALHIGSISLLRGSTPQAALALAERLHGRALISLDPNIRADLVADEPAYRATLSHLLARCDTLKLSLADLAWLERQAPAELAGAALDDSLALAARYLGRAGAPGPAVVALTLGAAGAALISASGFTLRQPAPQMTISDTVGAGDAFAAGLLSALAERGALTRDALLALDAAALAATLHWATLAAALTCMRPGADPPTRAEVAAALATE